MKDLIEKQFNKYQDQVLVNPELYVSSNHLTVTLIKELLEYSNASAGHSGFNSGARPVGIRVSVSGDVYKFRDEVFSSVETLTKFIESSECDGIKYIEGLKSQYINNGGQLGVKVNQSKLNFKVSELGRKLFGKDIFQKLISKFNKETVKTDYETLTVNEFSLRYGLSLCVV